MQFSILTALLAFHVWPFKCPVSSMAGALFNLSSHCRTPLSLADKNNVCQSLNKPKIKLTKTLLFGVPSDYQKLAPKNLTVWTQCLVCLLVTSDNWSLACPLGVCLLLSVEQCFLTMFHKSLLPSVRCE